MKPIDIALTQYGIVEAIGKEDNEEILKYFDEIGFNGAQLKDETAWCSAFVNYCCKVSDKAFSGKLNARSWLDIGEEVEEPESGDICVFWRSSPDSWKGHVGFYIAEDMNGIYLLGGNQQNMVCIKKYPKSRLLSIRRV